mmetsp:Transcript_10669/g.23525  ORF Transcript_10669/g.23525 Transcript_10669/m.23525 type:complete len:292 (+) Transcript_10669:734-1609(+)
MDVSPNPRLAQGSHLGKKEAGTHRCPPKHRRTSASRSSLNPPPRARRSPIRRGFRPPNPQLLNNSGPSPNFRGSNRFLGCSSSSSTKFKSRSRSNPCIITHSSTVNSNSKLLHSSTASSRPGCLSQSCSDPLRASRPPKGSDILKSPLSRLSGLTSGRKHLHPMLFQSPKTARPSQLLKMFLPRVGRSRPSLVRAATGRHWLSITPTINFREAATTWTRIPRQSRRRLLHWWPRWVKGQGNPYKATTMSKFRSAVVCDRKDQTPRPISTDLLRRLLKLRNGPREGRWPSHR